MTTEVERMMAREIKDLERTLDLIRAADMRAIKMWQEAHPGKDYVWPDRGKMIFWLLEEVNDARLEEAQAILATIDEDPEMAFRDWLIARIENYKKALAWLKENA